MTSISVIVATYGEKQWVKLAWERARPSVYGQDADELIVRHHHTGPIAAARNTAAEEATSDWLLFLDADDELAPGYLGAMRRALEQNTSDGTRVLLTPAVQQIRHGRPGKPFFYQEQDLREGNWMVIGTVISRELFTEVGGFHEHPHGLEDWNLWARAVRAGATIVKVPDAVYRAYVNPQSKHRRLFRDRRVFRAAYEAARADAWG